MSNCKSDKTKKTVKLDKFLGFKRLVDAGEMRRNEACRALEISEYMYKKWAKECENYTQFSSDTRLS